MNIDKLQGFVDHYKNNPTYCCLDLEAHLWYFRQMTLDEAIKTASISRDADNKRFSHQRMLAEKSLQSQATVLSSKINEIKKCQEEGGFHALYELVKQARVSGVGALTCYDIALRIGANLNIYPVYVYLHAGVIDGAVNIRAMKEGEQKPYLTIDELPPILTQLRPHEIEDFLCIFKKHFLELF
ncbi:MAG: hypothetical protein EAZ95_00225 [Bacteroidetes bacterium]|nr:MAG: hypothetical protein EAZ95_00225 [Bacteroidota bacterium]